MKHQAAHGLLSRIVIYIGFAATGVGMALPGAVLPVLLLEWHIADSQAGLFLFLGWMGTSLGALLVRPSRTKSLAIGCALTAVGLLGMAFSARWVCFGWMAVYGLGLGMVMTSGSLLQAARNADRRAVELNRLNLVWAAGACLGPTLAVHSLRVANTRTIFSAAGIFFALFGLWAVLAERETVPPTEPPAKIVGSEQGLGLLKRLGLWPASLLLVVILPTGIEASMGGWIAAYVQRTQQMIGTTVTAGTCFWLGLLISRLLSSTILLWRRSERIVLAQSLLTVVLGMTLLILSKASIGILPGVFLVGFGLGPVYPLLLAIALQYSENTLIFFTAGVGSALLPWITGIASSSMGSLRLGLFVPLTASVLMLILGLRQLITRRPQAPSSGDGLSQYRNFHG
jgi:FHS family glucose/mannose:H+ symporter-like MFS transporter